MSEYNNQETPQEDDMDAYGQYAKPNAQVKGSIAFKSSKEKEEFFRKRLSLLSVQSKVKYH